MQQHFKVRKWVALVIWAIAGWIAAVSFSLSPVSAVQAAEPTAAVVQPASAQTSSAHAQLYEGIEAFRAERFTAAIAAWQNALASYTHADDKLHQALILSNLSLAYQNTGQWQAAQRSLEESLAVYVQQIPRSSTEWEYYAKALNAQGWLYWRRGQPAIALERWQEATQAYESAKFFPGIIGSQINQAKAQQSLGLSIAAKDSLARLWNEIEQQGKPELKIMALQALGKALRRAGALDESQEALTAGLTLVEEAALSPTEVQATRSAILLDLGNTARAQWERAAALNLNDSEAHYADALEYYRQSAVAPSPLPRTQALANRLSLLVADTDGATPISPDTKAQDTPWLLWETLRTEFTELPLSRSSLRVRLNSVNSLLKLQTVRPSDALQPLDRRLSIAQVVEQSVQQARQLQDTRMESLALGQLGQLYEQEALALGQGSGEGSAKQRRVAKQLTQEAIAVSESIQSPDVQYRWEWQLGRLLKQQGDSQGAIQAFDQAVKTLDQVRQDLLYVDSDVQFSFRDGVEPLYRQFVDVLLSSANPSQENLRKATGLIDALQLAELENYLGCNIDSVQLTDRVVDPTAAIIYPIVLSDRVEVILQLPDQSLRHAVTPIAEAEFSALIVKLYETFPVQVRWRATQQGSSQLYDFLIRPFANDLSAGDLQIDGALREAESPNQRIETLVFVLDGALRNLPMAALWDTEREQYLLEQYAIAVAPSLELVEPKRLTRPVKVLSAGSSESLDHPFQDQDFAALQNVQKELSSIETIADADVLFNSTFTKANLERQLKREDYSIVHIASHGVFSAEPERTFIALTDSPIFAEDLDNLLRNRDSGSTIELLVLSACQTATGDSRATLGMAGLAVRAGARSTLATLWAVDDESAAVMMENFYQQLISNPDYSRAEALRQAQLQLLKSKDDSKSIWTRPYFWSPYVMVGNWL